MKKYIGVVLFSFLPMISSAVTVKLDDFKLWSTTYGKDTIRVLPIGQPVVASECADPDSYMVSTSLTEPAIARIYSTLLAAKMSGISVELHVDGCEYSRPAIRSVNLN
jgi:hypothetical protein